MNALMLLVHTYLRSNFIILMHTYQLIKSQNGQKTGGACRNAVKLQFENLIKGGITIKVLRFPLM